MIFPAPCSALATAAGSQTSATQRKLQHPPRNSDTETRATMDADMHGAHEAPSAAASASAPLTAHVPSPTMRATHELLAISHAMFTNEQQLDEGLSHAVPATVVSSSAVTAAAALLGHPTQAATAAAIRIPPHSPPTNTRQHKGAAHKSKGAARDHTTGSLAEETVASSSSSAVAAAALAAASLPAATAHMSVAELQQHLHQEKVREQALLLKLGHLHGGLKASEEALNEHAAASTGAVADSSGHEANTKIEAKGLVTQETAFEQSVGHADESATAPVPSVQVPSNESAGAAASSPGASSSTTEINAVRGATRKALTFAESQLTTPMASQRVLRARVQPQASRAGESAKPAPRRTARASAAKSKRRRDDSTDEDEDEDNEAAAAEEQDEAEEQEEAEEEEVPEADEAPDDEEWTDDDVPPRNKKNISNGNKRSFALASAAAVASAAQARRPQRAASKNVSASSRKAPPAKGAKPSRTKVNPQINQHPALVQHVLTALQYTLSREEIAALHPSERMKPMVMPIRWLCTSRSVRRAREDGRTKPRLSDIWVVAKDIATLIHKRRGSIAKAIAKFNPLLDKGRVRVYGCRSPGRPGTQLLTVLSMRGVQRLMRRSKYKRAREVCKWTIKVAMDLCNSIAAKEAGLYGGSAAAAAAAAAANDSLSAPLAPSRFPLSKVCKEDIQPIDVEVVSLESFQKRTGRKPEIVLRHIKGEELEEVEEEEDDEEEDDAEHSSDDADSEALERYALSGDAEDPSVEYDDEDDLQLAIDQPHDEEEVGGWGAAAEEEERDEGGAAAAEMESEPAAQSYEEDDGIAPPIVPKQTAEELRRQRKNERRRQRDREKREAKQAAAAIKSLDEVPEGIGSIASKLSLISTKTKKKAAKRALSPAAPSASPESPAAASSIRAPSPALKRAKQSIAQLTFSRTQESQFSLPAAAAGGSSRQSLPSALVTPESTPRLTPMLMSAASSGSNVLTQVMSQSRDITPLSSRQSSPLPLMNPLVPRRHLRLSSKIMDAADLTAIGIGVSPRGGASSQQQQQLMHSSAFHASSQGPSLQISHSNNSSAPPSGPSTPHMATMAHVPMFPAMLSPSGGAGGSQTQHHFFSESSKAITSLQPFQAQQQQQHQQFAMPQPYMASTQPLRQMAFGYFGNSFTSSQQGSGFMNTSPLHSPLHQQRRFTQQLVSSSSGYPGQTQSQLMQSNHFFPTTHAATGGSSFPSNSFANKENIGVTGASAAAASSSSLPPSAPTTPPSPAANRDNSIMAKHA